MAGGQWHSLCEPQGASRGLVAYKTPAASALRLTVKRQSEYHWAGGSQLADAEWVTLNG